MSRTDAGSDEGAAAIRQVLDYHRLSGLDPQRPPAAPAKLDRASEPIPFRRYEGAPPLPLPLGEEREDASSRALGRPLGDPFDLASLGRFLDDGLGLAGWKRAGEAAFGMRRTPSAGNLHPTEAYVATSGGVSGLAPGLYHYSSFDHALACRRHLRLEQPGLWIGLSTLYWRSAWKYGERAFRLCQLDAGHAAAALAVAAALAGWTLQRIELHDEELAAGLGLAEEEGPEAEHGLLLFALSRPGGAAASWQARFMAPERSGTLFGRPSQISRCHREWPGIARARLATALSRQAAGRPAAAADGSSSWPDDLPAWPRQILRQRRSSSRFDPQRSLGLEELSAVLSPLAEAASWLFPFRGDIGILLFVHRVEGLEPGLYHLGAAGAGRERLRQALRQDFGWQPVGGIPLPLSLLAAGDARAAAASLSGGQEAAGSSSFTVLMIGRLAGLLAAEGAWAYRALHWQAGEIGHRLYLAATAAGLGVTGLSGFYDERLAELLGLRGGAWAPLYLVAAGPRAVADPALESPAVHRSTEAAPVAPSRGGHG